MLEKEASTTDATPKQLLQSMAIFVTFISHDDRTTCDRRQQRLSSDTVHATFPSSFLGVLLVIKHLETQMQTYES